MPILYKVESFLEQHHLLNSLVLLGLSGGPDSLSLFYLLLELQQSHGLNFHAAHIDHGWREKSGEEAEILHRLALEHQIPFHIKKLDPSLMKGNLEEACRKARQDFFRELVHQYKYEAIVLGHQQNDQVETVLKRLFEGSSWHHLSGLQSDCRVNEIRIVRPLLNIPKDEIIVFLQERRVVFFEDPTNKDPRFTRAKMREKIIPVLNEMFGKKIDLSLVHLAHETNELMHYFNALIEPVLARVVQGPLGFYVDLSTLCSHPILCKHFLRRFCEQQKFFLSREIVSRATTCLINGDTDKTFIMGKKKLIVDRQVLFIVDVESQKDEFQRVPLEVGYSSQMGAWQVKVSCEKYQGQVPSSWRDVWSGHCQTYLPVGDYHLFIPKIRSISFQGHGTLREWWNRYQVPAFLRGQVPVIGQSEKVISEFLSGQSLNVLKIGEPCLKIHMCLSKRICL